MVYNIECKRVCRPKVRTSRIRRVFLFMTSLERSVSHAAAAAASFFCSQRVEDCWIVETSLTPTKSHSATKRRRDVNSTATSPARQARALLMLQVASMVLMALLMIHLPHAADRIVLQSGVCWWAPGQKESSHRISHPSCSTGRIVL